MVSKHLLIFILFIILIPANLYSQKQSKENLQANKQKIEDEIRYTNDLINQTKKNKKTSLDQLVLIERQIERREKLIRAISQEADFLDNQIDFNNDSIKDLNNELKNLKQEYAELIYFAYKNKSIYNRLMFIFSSKDFNQAYRRSKYFQQYSSYRKTQADLIKQTQLKIEEKIIVLEKQKAEKTALLADQKLAIEDLSQEKEIKNQTVQELNKKEKDLRKKLRDKEKAANKLQKEIEKIIADEIRLAAEKAMKEADMKKKDDMALTPVELQLSEEFEANKGRLPWPAKQGVISGTFGEHAHPILKRVKVKNNGIDLLTTEGSQVNVIFDGVVTRVVSVPSYNNVVIIRHGEFLSVYSNLNEVYVKKGDRVSTLQSIGTVFTEKDTGKTELHFELWKAKTLQNPLLWLKQR
ncbi:murein hydrolase activator EnvC family protein [Bacteroidota bacterium]